MSKLTGNTLAGIIAVVVVVAGGGYWVYTHFLPPPPPPVAHANISITTPIAAQCDANPPHPTLANDGTVTFHTQAGHQYSLRFTNGYPFTSGNNPLAIHDGDSFTAKHVLHDTPYPYDPIDEGNCHPALHDIGIIVSH
jgi:hypothetical protein